MHGNPESAIPWYRRQCQLIIAVANLDLTPLNKGLLLHHMDNSSACAGPTAPAQAPVLENSSAVLAEQAALEAEMEAVGQPKAMDGKLLLSVMAALQGSGLGQALGKVATQKEEEKK